MSRELPAKPDIEHLKNQAKDCCGIFRRVTQLRKNVSLRSPRRPVRNSPTRCLSWRANMALPVGRSSRSTYNPGRVYSHGRLWRWHDALLAAVQRSDRKTIDVLLRAGADINARSHFWAGGLSLSVLHACAHDMAAFLIERAPPWMRMQPPASAGSKSCRTW